MSHKNHHGTQDAPVENDACNRAGREQRPKGRSALHTVIGDKHRKAQQKGKQDIAGTRQLKRGLAQVEHDRLKEQAVRNL